jgi:hypothetical protein
MAKRATHLMDSIARRQDARERRQRDVEEAITDVRKRLEIQENIETNRPKPPKTPKPRRK